MSNFENVNNICNNGRILKAHAPEQNSESAVQIAQPLKQIEARLDALLKEQTTLVALRNEYAKQLCVLQAEHEQKQIEEEEAKSRDPFPYSGIGSASLPLPWFAADAANAVRHALLATLRIALMRRVKVLLRVQVQIRSVG